VQFARLGEEEKHIQWAQAVTQTPNEKIPARSEFTAGDSFGKNDGLQRLAHGFG
jgi:hypothetical protein